MAAEAPANPQTGDAWYDTTNKVLKIWVKIGNSNPAWALAMPNRVYVSASDPSTSTTVVNGDIWFDTSKNILYVRANGAWVADTTTRVRVSGTALTTGHAGDIYFDSTAGCLKIYNGTAWQAVVSYTVTVEADGNKAKIILKGPGKDDRQEVILAASGSASLAVDPATKKITVGAKDTKYSMNASSGAAQSSAKITLQEDGSDKNNVTIKGTGIADVSYKDNAINVQVGRYKIVAVGDENSAALQLVHEKTESASSPAEPFEVPISGSNGVTVAVGSDNQINIEGKTYTLSSAKNGDAIEIVLTDNKGGTAKGTIKIGEGLAVEAGENGLTLKSTVKAPAYTIGVAEKTGGGATISLNKEGESKPAGTVNIVAGANSTVSVDENQNVVVASTDTNTTYTLSGTVAGGVATITLKDNLNKTSTVKIGQGDNVTLTVENGVIKIKAVDTVYTVGKVAENNGVTVKLTDNKAGSTSQDVAFVPGDNASISLTGGKVVIGVVTQGTIGQDTADGAIPNVGAIKKYVAGGIAASDAMVFRGTIGAADKNPTVTALPEGAGVGDTYKVVSDGTYGTLAARVGDIIIYAKDLGWVLVPSGDDGNVYHAEELTEGQVVVGAGTASVKTLPAGTDNQILRMKDGKAAWTNETPESQLTVAGQETATDTDTTVLTGMAAEGHEITPKRKNVLGQKDIHVVSSYGNINVSVTYTKNNVVTDLNADTDVLILNGGTASTVL